MFTKTTESTSLYDDLENKSTIEMLSDINREDQKVALAVQDVLPQIENLVNAAFNKLANAGRLFYIGAGTSGRLGILDASECPPTFGVDHNKVIGLIAGFAARPVLGNMIAGLQIGLSQPIRIQDVVIVEGEWGVIEEITRAYVVVRIWDDRRLIVPLQYWVEKPFQNWTRSSAELTGTVTLWVDYRLPLEPLRQALRQACESSRDWDGRTCLLQVTEAGERAMQLRALVTAANAPQAWDLRCHVRERLIDFVQREYPQYLPRLRLEGAVGATIDAVPPPPTASGVAGPAPGR